MESKPTSVAGGPAAGQAMAEPLKIGVVSSNVERVGGREAGMPPTTKIGGGGGGWSCGARAKHHHRKRLRNPEFFALRTTTYGVASSSCRASRRQQRQKLSLRATSRWRGGVKQIALAPCEGQALEERSSSSRSSTSWPRTRGQQLPCVRRRQRQQLAPRASRWRRGGAKQTALAPREGQALENGRVPRAPR